MSEAAALAPDGPTAAPARAPALRLEGIQRRFHQADVTLDVLRGVDLALQPGEAVALIGPSGSGKSTLLQVAGLLERPSGGEVYVRGEACGALSDSERTRIRRDSLGFVYQFHHLLPEFSALENVVLPQMVAGTPRAAAERRADELLKSMGLGAREHHRPARLSGGEQQRVAIARALANRPAVILADEPTGNLDEETASAVFASLTETVRATAVTLLIATHNPELAARTDRTLRLHNGSVETVERVDRTG